MESISWPGLMASEGDRRALAPCPRASAHAHSLPSLRTTLPWIHCTVAAYHQGAASQQPQNLPPEPGWVISVAHFGQPGSYAPCHVPQGSTFPVGKEVFSSLEKWVLN